MHILSVLSILIANYIHLLIIRIYIDTESVSACKEAAILQQHVSTEVHSVDLPWLSWFYPEITAEEDVRSSGTSGININIVCSMFSHG